MEVKAHRDLIASMLTSDGGSVVGGITQRTVNRVSDLHPGHVLHLQLCLAAAVRTPRGSRVGCVQTQAATPMRYLSLSLHR